MGLDMDLYPVKKHDIKSHREIAQRNLDKFRYEQAQRALAGDVNSSALFMLAGEGNIDFSLPDFPPGLEILSDIWQRVLLEGPTAPPGEVTTYRMEMWANDFTIALNDEYVKHVEEMKDFVQKYEQDGPSALSETAQHMLDANPALQNEYILMAPIQLEEHEKEFFDKYHLYWRKANHIHSWFVNRVQAGQDDQEQHVVSKEDLLALKESLEKAIEIYAAAKLDPETNNLSTADAQALQEVLPTTPGFFFGSTDYSSGYDDYNKSTLSSINVILEEVDFDKYMFLYQADW